MSSQHLANYFSDKDGNAPTASMAPTSGLPILILIVLITMLAILSLDASATPEQQFEPYQQSLASP